METDHNIQPESAEEIGLKVITTTKHGIPTSRPTGGTIVKNCEGGIYKWTYQEKSLSEDYVWSLITTDKLKITAKDFKIVDPSEYRRVRSGKQDDRSPLQLPQSKYKK